MAGPQLEKGFTRIAHELLEAVASHEIPRRMKDVLLLVIRSTYGAPGSPKTAELDLVNFAAKCDSTTQLLRRNLARLVSVGMITVEKVRLGVWRVGPQKDPAKWIAWSVIVERERAARGPREKQLDLIVTAPGGAVGGTGRCRPAAPPGAAPQHRAVPPSLQKLQPLQDLRPARDRDIGETETDVVPDAVPAARGPAPTPATTRPSSKDAAGKPPPSASNDGALFPPGFWENEAIRLGAEKRLRAALTGGLEPYAREVAEEMHRSALRAERELHANPRRYVSGLIGRRDRVREIAAGFESRAAEARAALEKPPPGPGPQGAPRPKVSPSGGAVLAEKGPDGRVVERRPQASAMRDCLAMLAGLGVDLGFGRAA